MDTARFVNIEANSIRKLLKYNDIGKVADETGLKVTQLRDLKRGKGYLEMDDRRKLKGYLISKNIWRFFANLGFVSLECFIFEVYSTAYLYYSLFCLLIF